MYPGVRHYTTLSNFLGSLHRELRLFFCSAYLAAVPFDDGEVSYRGIIGVGAGQFSFEFKNGGKVRIPLRIDIN